MVLIQDARDAYAGWMAAIDKRVVSWPLMANPWPTLAICLMYCLAAYILPKMLKGQVFQITWAVRAYNLCMVAINFYIAKELLRNSVGYVKNWQCDPLVFGEDDRLMAVAGAIWWFYISKSLEMLDTIFFILRGKYEHVSFLHVYHHSTILFMYWIAAAYMAGGASVPAAIINSSIHVLMYGYYFLAALGPHMQKYLWWKRYLTRLQILQFAFNVFFNLNVLFRFGDTCNYPMWMVKLCTWYNVSFIILFSNFYMKSYIKGKERSKSH